MADFRVQAQELAAKAGELRSLKDNLQAKCGEYYDKGGALASSFEGDTASMFQKEVTDHVNKMTEFIQLVERYCETMEQAAQRYAKADSDSADVVRAKNY